MLGCKRNATAYLFSYTLQGFHQYCFKVLTYYLLYGAWKHTERISQSLFASLLLLREASMNVRKAIRVNLSLSNSVSDWGVLFSLQVKYFFSCLNTHRSSDIMMMKTRWKMNYCYKPNTLIYNSNSWWKSAHHYIFPSIELFGLHLHIHMQYIIWPFLKACIWFHVIQFHFHEE